MPDRPQSVPYSPNPTPHAALAPGVDPLSDVLRSVRLTGAVFFVVEAPATWCGAMPQGVQLASIVLPQAQTVISYHVVTRGACWGCLPNAAPVLLDTGDVVVFPHGDPYAMSVERACLQTSDTDETVALMRGISARRFPFVLGDPSVAKAGIVCGFLGCDLRPFNPLLAALPRLLVVRRTSAAQDRLEQLVELTLAESRRALPGGECFRLRLSELLFLEVVRRYLTTLPDDHAGWLAGVRDTVVGRALSMLHERPAHAWTLPELARQAGVSRSALAERFTRLVGAPPMQYLTCWRMQLAGRLLIEGAAKVSAVAAEVGYDSEAAFSRAFKKVTGVSPASWRHAHIAAP